MCALDGAMELLGKKWVLFVINSIGSHGTMRFKELYEELRGVSPSTLSWILRELHSAGVVDRKSFAEIPPGWSIASRRTEGTCSGRSSPCCCGPASRTAIPSAWRTATPSATWRSASALSDR